MGWGEVMRVCRLNASVSSKKQQFNRTETSENVLLVWLIAVQFIQMIGNRLLEAKIPSLIQAVSGLVWGDDGYLGVHADEVLVS